MAKKRSWHFLFFLDEMEKFWGVSVKEVRKEISADINRQEWTRMEKYRSERKEKSRVER